MTRIRIARRLASAALGLILIVGLSACDPTQPPGPVAPPTWTPPVRVDPFPQTGPPWPVECMHWTPEDNATCD